jgi:hypothetical protein
MKKNLTIFILIFSLLLGRNVISQQPCPYTCVDVPLCTQGGGTCLGQYQCPSPECCCQFAGGGGAGGGGEIGTLINKVINSVINIAMAGAGIIIIVGGYLMVTSAGNPEQFERGKKTLLYGAIGFILIFAARELAQGIINIIK